MVPDRSTNAEVVAMAEQISAAQQPEINAMRVFLVQWNENPQDDTSATAEAAATRRCRAWSTTPRWPNCRR